MPHWNQWGFFMSFYSLLVGTILASYNYINSKNNGFDPKNDHLLVGYMESVMKLVILFVMILSTLSISALAHDDRFIDAIKFSSLKKVKRMLDNGANPNHVWIGKADQKSKPAIFFALESERIEMFKLLVIYGADVNVKKSGDGVRENNLLMVAFRKYGRRETQGKMVKLIKLLLDGEFDVSGKRYTFDFNPYARGGMDGQRDAISVIHKNFGRVESLGLLYTHKNIEPTKFGHKRNYITLSIRRGYIDFLNLYLEFNSDRIDSKLAKRALEILNLEYSKKPELVDMELTERLRSIAF
jgi:hypothetical protein